MASARFAYSISLNAEQEVELRKVLDTDGSLKVIDVFMSGVQLLIEEKGINHKKI